MAFNFGSKPSPSEGFAFGGRAPGPAKEPSATVKFNVGGKIYEVARSLLKKYPTTDMAKKASSSSPSPIFIDRDPDRFAFCLDYMRDNGKVYLPETVSKMAVLEELRSLGFENVDYKKICDEKSQQSCVTRFHQIAETCNQRIDYLQKEIAALEHEAAVLERNRCRRKVEIKLEKVVLKCLAKSVENLGKDRFLVEYNHFDFRDLSYIHRDQYFIERCRKLGLCVDRSREVDACPREVYLTRIHETNAEGAHQE